MKCIGYTVRTSNGSWVSVSMRKQLKNRCSGIDCNLAETCVMVNDRGERLYFGDIWPWTLTLRAILNFGPTRHPLCKTSTRHTSNSVKTSLYQWCYNKNLGRKANDRGHKAKAFNYQDQSQGLGSQAKTKDSICQGQWQKHQSKRWSQNLYAV